MAGSLLRSAWDLVRFKMDTLIVFVTTRCNCRCATCFYWRELGRARDLSLEHLRKIAVGVGDLRSLMLSGGEPFLRDDLAEIATIFRRHSRIRKLSIPTNGTCPKAAEALVTALSPLLAQVKISINVSLDGPEDVHNRIRGRSTVFAQALETLRRVGRLRAEFSNLEVNVTTVLCQYNASHVPALLNALDGIPIDHHNFEIIRGDARDGVLNRGRESLVATFQEACLRAEVRGRSGRPAGGLAAFLDRAHRFYLCRLKSRYLAKGRGWGFPCLAGKAICAIDTDGSLRACELRKPVVNLAAFDFDIRRALRSRAFQYELRDITKSACSCTHGCFLSVSARRSLPAILWRAPATYMRERRLLGRGDPCKSPSSSPSIA